MKVRGQGRPTVPALLEGVIVRLLLGGGPYLTIHLFEKRLAPLVEFLVILLQRYFLHRESLEAFGDLIHVHLVVAFYRKHGRLRRPLGALDRGANRPRRGAQQPRGRIAQGAHARLSALGGLLGARPVAREGGV